MMMGTCQEVAKLVSEGHDRKLSLGQRMKVRLHLAGCVVCRRFSKQIALIRRLTRTAGMAESGWLVAEGGAFDESLSTEAKERMKQELARRNPRD